MKTIKGRLAGIRFTAVLSVLALASSASATAYLTVITTFVCSLAGSIRMIGNSIGIIMFIYGALKYMYTADDPGGRKQAMGICVAAIMALIIIQAAIAVMNLVGSQMTSGPSVIAGVIPQCPSL